MCRNSIVFLSQTEAPCTSTLRAGELEILAAVPSFLECFFGGGASCLVLNFFFGATLSKTPPLAHTFPLPPHNAMDSPHPLALDTTPSRNFDDALS